MSKIKRNRPLFHDELMALRRKTWAKCEIQPNTLIPRDRYLDEEWRIRCNLHHCRSRHNLRLTPSGVWCFDHYCGTEMIRPCSIPGCHEPVLDIESSGLGNDRRFCRDHWLGELDNQDMAELSFHIFRDLPDLVAGGPLTTRQPRVCYEASPYLIDPNERC